MANLVALAKIDGHFHQDEIAFLKKIGEKYKLKPHQITGILNSKKKHKVEVPNTFRQKTGLFYELVGMMLADGVIDDKEMEFCQSIAQQFKLDSGILQKIIDYYREGGEDYKDWSLFQLELGLEFDMKN